VLHTSTARPAMTRSRARPGRETATRSTSRRSGPWLSDAEVLVMNADGYKVRRLPLW